MQFIFCNKINLPDCLQSSYTKLCMCSSIYIPAWWLTVCPGMTELMHTCACYIILSQSVNQDGHRLAPGEKVLVSLRYLGEKRLYLGEIVSIADFISNGFQGFRSL